jgi:hypothetical protein
VIDAVQRSGIKGRTVNAEIAQPGQGRSSRDDGRGRDGGFRGGFRDRDRDRRGDFQGRRDGGYGGGRFDRDQGRDSGYRRDFDRDAPPRQFERSGPPRRDFERSGPPRFEREDEPNGNVRTPPSFTRDRDRSGPGNYGNRRDDATRRYDRNPNRGPSGNRRDY